MRPHRPSGPVLDLDRQAVPEWPVLVAHAKEGVGARSVNKHRQTLAAIFNFGLRPEQAEHWRLTKNPAAMAAKRREDPPARMEVFTVEQVELLARTAEATDPLLGEMVRLAAYTGLRRGELVTLKWRDVRWGERVLVVERALSGGVEGTTKSRRARYVPLADQALGALDRLSRRPNFTSADDYVFAGSAGDRLDDSAIRRRYVQAREAGGLPPLRFHDGRHSPNSRARPGDSPRRPRPCRPKDDGALPACGTSLPTR